MRICPITGSDKWQHYYTSKNNRIITGDQRISEGKLEKIICTDSGVVANKRRFSSEELEVLYGKEYELNTLGKEEHFFYTNEGRLSRSEVFYNWILPHLPKKFERSFSNSFVFGPIPRYPLNITFSTLLISLEDTDGFES